MATRQNLFTAVALFVTLSAKSAFGFAVEETCDNQATCESVSAVHSAHASAMMQLRATPEKVAMIGTESAHVTQSRLCIPEAIQEVHLQAIRKHAALLATGARKVMDARNFTDIRQHIHGEQPPSMEDPAQPTTVTTTPEPTTSTTMMPTTTMTTTIEPTPTPTEEPATTEAPTAPPTQPATMAPTAPPAKPATTPAAPPAATNAPTTKAPITNEVTPELGRQVPLNAAGFKLVTELCCPQQTEQFFNRLLDSMGLQVCSKPHIQGLMHWFTCVPDMDFQYVLDTINNGNPCKFWEFKGTVCPPLSPQCAGHWCR